MKIYKKENLIKSANKIILHKDRMQIFNPTHEMLIEDGWEEVVKTEPTAEQLFVRAQRNKIAEINHFDSSEEVNQCYIIYGDQEIPYWSSKAERNDLKQAVQDYKAKGYESYRLDLRDVGVSLTFPCDALLSMLSDLEVYAINCYNVTTDHIFAVNAMNTTEELDAYNYRIGYPEKLRFTING